MKRSFFQACVCFLTLLPVFVAAQPDDYVDLGIFNSPSGSNKLEIRIRPTEDVVNLPLSQGSFTVRFLHSYGVTLSKFSSSYNFPFLITGINVQDPVDLLYYDYYSWSFIQAFTENYTAFDEYVIAVLAVSQNGNGNGVFELRTYDFWTIDNNANFYWELDGDSRNNILYEPEAINVPLPVELLTFTARAQPNHTTLLDWKSASEVDLSFFSIEHSTNGLDFNPIGKIESLGSVNDEQAYDFIHTTPKDGSNYYRLKMVDQDGSFEYSPIRIVEFNDTEDAFSLLPNPTAGPLELLTRNLDKYDSSLRYQLTDNNSKLLQENQIVDETTKFDLSTYPSGIYYLNVMNDLEQIQQYKVVVTPN